MSAVLDLFAGDVDQTVEQQHVAADPVAAAIFAIESVLLSGKALALAYSSGKDSSTVANLAFTAALNVKRRTGHCPPIHVLNADTGVESPAVRALADRELARMRAFARPTNCRSGRMYRTRRSAPRGRCASSEAARCGRSRRTAPIAPGITRLDP